MTDNCKMSATQMVDLLKNMNNGERIDFLGWLYDNYFNSKPVQDTPLVTKATNNHIEDYLDRDLTEDELNVIKLAYEDGYYAGCHKGRKQVLNGIEQ